PGLLFPPWRQAKPVSAATFNALSLLVPAQHVNSLDLSFLQILWLEIQKHRIALAGFGLNPLQDVRFLLAFAQKQRASTNALNILQHQAAALMTEASLFHEFAQLFAVALRPLFSNGLTRFREVGSVAD